MDLVDPGGLAKAPILFEDLGRALPVAGGEALARGGRRPRLLFAGAEAEELLPARGALRGSEDGEREQSESHASEVEGQSDSAQGLVMLGSKPRGGQKP